MKTPPDKQVLSLLAYLYQALRTDTEILGATDAEPEEICVSFRDYQPIQREDGEIVIYGTELPAICYSTQRTTHHRRGSPRPGRQRFGILWYLFMTPGSDGDDVHALAKAERIKGLIDWRIPYWMQVQKLPPEGDNAGDLFNLQDESNARLFTLGEAKWFNEESIQGIMWDLEIEHLWAPYDEVSPAVVELYNMTITDASGPSVSGVIDV